MWWRDSDTYADSYGNGYGYSYSYSYSYANSNLHAYGYGYGHCDFDAYGYCGAKVDTNAKATSNTSATISCDT